MLHVIYRSGAEIVAAVAKGEVDDPPLTTLSSSHGFLQSGAVRAVAVTMPAPVPALPGVAPMAETVPGVTAPPLYGWLGPAGMPAGVVARRQRRLQRDPGAAGGEQDAERGHRKKKPPLAMAAAPSPATAELLEAAITGARDPEITGVEVVRRAALSAGPADVLAADAVPLGTPANIGYMSGALKHFFDVVYYPVADDTRGLPYGLYVHGNLDTAGAITAVETIAAAWAGSGWPRRSRCAASRTRPPVRRWPSSPPPWPPR